MEKISDLLKSKQKGMAGEGEKEDDEESERERKEREGEVEKEEEEDAGDRKLGRVMELPRVKYWEDKRVTIFISGKKG